MKVLCIKERKKYAEVVNIYNKNNSVGNCEEARRIHVGFVVIPQTTKVTVTVHDKCLDKMKKELSCVCKYRKKLVYAGFISIHSFRHPLGILEDNS